MAETLAANEERWETYGTCLAAKGWDLSIDHLGGVTLSEGMSDSDVDRLLSDSEACADEYGLREDRIPSEEEIRVQYRRNLDVRDCLIAQGVNLVESPPAEDVWVDGMIRLYANPDSGGAPIWSPYGDSVFEGDDETRFNELQLICPQP
jgi:hypothetical protein